MYTHRSSDSGSANLACCLVVLVINLLVGSWSVNFLLETFLNKTIPWIGAALIGLVAGEFTVPVAIVVWLLKLFGVL